MNNIFLGTLENMVFCINEIIGVNLNKEVNKKGCTVIDCTTNYTSSRQLIIASTNECVEKCPENSIFFYDYKCYYKCPNNTLPEDYMCKEPVINETFVEVDNVSCTVKKYFLKFCKKNLYNKIAKKKFIDATVDDFVEAKLHDLISMSIENQKIFYVEEKSEIYSIYALSNKNREPNLAYIDLEECANKLQNTYKFLYNDLIVFKIEYSSSDLRIPIIEYKIFGVFGTKKLTLHSCKGIKAHYYIPRNISDYEEYIYNPESDYYYDECHNYVNENNNDLTLYERRNDFNVNNRSLCESSCVFRGYIDNVIHCECDIKIKFNSFLNNDIDKYNLIYRFPTKKILNFNIWVFKCFMNLFSLEIILSNLSSQIILGIILFSLICALIFYFKEFKSLYEKIKIVIQLSNPETQIQTSELEKINIKKNKKKTLFDNIKKKSLFKKDKKSNFENTKNDESSSRKELKFIFGSSKYLSKKHSNKNKNILTKNTNINFDNKNIVLYSKYKIYEEKTYGEINSLSYKDALMNDKRTLCEIYCSIIMTKQLLLFTFNSKNDFNSRIIKICFLLYILALSFTINTLFMDDNIMHDLVVLHDNIGIFFNLKNIILTALITLIIKNILLVIAFTDDDITSIRTNVDSNNNDIIRNVVVIVTIKCYMFFVINLISLIFMWVYIACFFSVYKNTQFFVLKNTLLSFVVCLLIPVFLGMIPAILRWASLQSREKKNRLPAYYIAKVIQILI